MPALRRRVEIVELLGPSREWRGARRAQSRGTVAVIQLGSLAISCTPVAECYRRLCNARFAERCRWEHHFGECGQSGGVILEVCECGSVRASHDDRERHGCGEGR